MCHQVYRCKFSWMIKKLFIHTKQHQIYSLSKCAESDISLDKVIVMLEEDKHHLVRDFTTRQPKRCSWQLPMIFEEVVNDLWGYPLVTFKPFKKFLIFSEMLQMTCFHFSLLSRRFTREPQRLYDRAIRLWVCCSMQQRSSEATFNRLMC